MQSFPKWAKHMMRPTIQSMSEDCLYLNIWTKTSSLSAKDSSPKTKPILFWIHGGGYQFGSGTLHETNGTVLAALEDVIVVTINYRLNAFGFLNLESEEVPGNMGLYDQAMALQWIHDNALVFGGDSSHITVWGQGMGSISVSAMIVSPLTKDLIRRGIMQTGSIFTTRPMYARYTEVAEDFIHHAGCQPNDTDSNSELESAYATFYSDNESEEGDSDSDQEDSKRASVIACLRKLSASRLVAAASRVNEVNPTSFMFSPQDAFFNHSSLNVIRQDLRSFLSNSLKDLMIGFNSDEGSLLLNSLDQDTFPDDEGSSPKISSQQEARNFLADLFVNRLQIPRSIITAGLDAEFPTLIPSPLSSNLSSSSFQSRNGSGTETPVESEDNTKSIVKKMIDFLGNNVFVCPTILFGEEVAAIEEGPLVHAFHWKERSSYNRLPEWYGTIHNEEVPIMFGYPLRYPHDFGEKEKTFSRNIMKTISNFSKSG
jgi:carboxylesterase type B